MPKKPPSTARATPGSDAPAALVNLNTASADALARLPGIGPALARRIVAHRTTIGPFAAASDITAVSGVGPAVYNGIADRLTVGEAEPRQAEAAPSTAAAGVEIPSPTTAPPEPEPAARVEREKPPAEPAPAKEGEPATALQSLIPWVPPLAGTATRDWRGLIGAGVAGALLGAILTLLVIAGLNGGTLALNQQRDVGELTIRADDLDSRLGAVEASDQALRSRLAALEGLTGRVDKAEASLSGMETAVGTLQADVASLGDKADQLAADVASVQAAAQRFDAFLAGLRELLQEFEAAGQPTPGGGG